MEAQLIGTENTINHRCSFKWLIPHPISSDVGFSHWFKVIMRCGKIGSCWASEVNSINSVSICYYIVREDFFLERRAWSIFISISYTNSTVRRHLLYVERSISSGSSPTFTSKRSWTSFRIFASFSSETNVIARPLVPNRPALATWHQRKK